MKPHWAKRLTIILCAVLIGICAFRIWQHQRANTERLEKSKAFYYAFLGAASEKDEIEIAELIPASWDKMYVFGAYASQKEKFAAAGCQYNISVGDGVSEGLVSMLFMNGDEVAYYVEFFPQEIPTSLSIYAIIDRDFDGAVFDYDNAPRLVRSPRPADLQTADEVVRFTLTARN